ncbi:unnamed protein product [Caenorhabditis auriculariae]|uniref:PPM-type phosphatase domain-containing protein n=1 Tax=Caenorhabditis auriculariae TaxID=2777116 RepID=A0A8S1HBA0_9PELO|nr:unnamed protein product [Caenorhabditis auriculariae]
MSCIGPAQPAKSQISASVVDSQPEEFSPSTAVTSSTRLPTVSSILQPRFSDEPLPVVPANSSLRTWRITREGLVQCSDAYSMGAFLDKPKTVKTNTDGQGNGLKYAMSSMQGWRVDMEDAHVVEVSMADREPYKEWSFFAVFDGHAGSLAADDAAQNILQTLIDTEQFEKVTASLKSNNGVLSDECLKLMEEGIKHGFLSLDERIRQKLDTNRSGSTAVCAILTPTHIIIANLGDSRAVLSRSQEPAFGTEDHKPYNDKERQRIEEAGGSVMIQRINGSLAVSRAFGDFEYKNVPGLPAVQQLVSPEPDVYVLKRNHEKDEFMVLACDGVYDVMENDELANFVRGRLNVHTDLKLVCNEFFKRTRTLTIVTAVQGSSHYITQPTGFEGRTRESPLVVIH